MFDSLIAAVQGAVKPYSIEFEGKPYSSHQLHLPPDEKSINPLKVSTLQSLVDYLTTDFDEGLPSLAIHVVSPRRVNLITKLDDQRTPRRDVVVCVELPSSQTFPFGKFMEQDEFVIFLISRFEDSGDRADLLKIIGCLSQDSSVKNMDDGVTTKTTVQSGVALREDVTVNPIQRLAPYRTFSDISQPILNFLVRIRQGKSGPEIALFEADGGAWEVQAVDSIARWLSVNLNELDLPILG